MFLFIFLFMFLFMTFYQCFFIMFLNKRIGKISIIYYVLSHWIHSISRQMHCNWENLYHLLCASSFYFLTKSIFFENTITSSTRSYWGNPYHLLCASPLYFSTGALGKPLSFTMCFPIGFILFLGGRIVIGETPIIYYVLLHSILRRARFSLKTRLRTQPALTGETPIIYYVLPHRVHSIPRRAHCHWGNLYYLMGASPLDRVIGETSIIYYVLPHPILRRAPWGHPYYLLCASPSNRVSRSAHCHWGTLYYFVCASPSWSSASALPLGKPLLFSGCFPSYRCSRLGTDPDRGRCQAIPRDIGETSII